MHVTKKKLRSYATIALPIATIGFIIVSIGVVLTQAAQSRARDVQRRAHLQQVETTLKQYYEDEGLYPLSMQFGAALCASAGCPTKTYEQRLPVDPSGYEYIYRTNANRTYYYLYSCLENPPKDGVKPLTIDCGCPLPGSTCDQSLTNQPEQ